MNYVLTLTVTTWGSFVIVRQDEWGHTQTVYESSDLGQCLSGAASALGRPISLPLKASPL